MTDVYRRRHRNKMFLLIGFLIFTIVVCAWNIYYVVWQFQLCYPEVSESWWFCYHIATRGTN